MNSLLLHVVSRTLLPLSLVFSLYLLWRGHNEPGGGFVGGLILAVGIIVYALPRGRESLLTLIRVSPESIAGFGVLLALVSGLPAFLHRQSFLTHQWTSTPIGLALGTPLVFDFGVYLAVAGAVLTFLVYFLE